MYVSVVDYAFLHYLMSLLPTAGQAPWSWSSGHAEVGCKDGPGPLKQVWRRQQASEPQRPAGSVGWQAPLDGWGSPQDAPQASCLPPPPLEGGMYADFTFKSPRENVAKHGHR